MADSGARGWARAVALYGDRRILVILALGFSSGLPLALTGATMSAWLKTSGVDKTTIGLFALVGLPYAFKFVWSPAIDGLRVPFLTRALGRRRSWAILSQFLLMAAVLALGAAEPARAPAVVAALALAVAFLSASQDIVIDAYRVEILADHEQGAGAAAIQIGYRIGMLASGAGALYLADAYGFHAAYMVMAALVAVGVATVLLNPEPKAGAAATPDGERVNGSLVDWIKLHVVAPFADFMSRPGWIAILAFAILYKFGDAISGYMATPLYIELGFTLSEIASVTKVFGLGATIAGSLLGGLAVANWGIPRALLACGALQSVTILLYIVQAKMGHDVGMLAVTVAGENLTGGMGSAALVAYLSSLTRVAFTATQYALFSALAALGRIAANSASGWLADRFDWTTFFLIATAASLPGLLLLGWIFRRRR